MIESIPCLITNLYVWPGAIIKFAKVNEKGEVKDYAGYHKAIYAAENADTIANHFYEQGKADAVKDMMAKSKNVSNKPRVTSTGDVFINGLKVKAISGVDSSKLKIKTKQK